MAVLPCGALRRTWKQGARPCVSTGRSIHAVPSITPSPREGIENGSTGGPALRLDEPKNGVAVGFAGSAHSPEPRVGPALSAILMPAIQRTFPMPVFAIDSTALASSVDIAV
jgi:hypothetical protein